jgi:hypothetical protein
MVACAKFLLKAGKVFVEQVDLSLLVMSVLEIGELGNLRFIGLVGLGPASRVFTFHLLDSLLTATTKISICPQMTSYSNRVIRAIIASWGVYQLKHIA